MTHPEPDPDVPALRVSPDEAFRWLQEHGPADFEVWAEGLGRAPDEVRGVQCRLVQQGRVVREARAERVEGRRRFTVWRAR